MSVKTLRKTGHVADVASSVFFLVDAVAVAIATVGLVGA